MKIKPSIFYQKWTQIVGRCSDVLTCLIGVYAGKEMLWAVCLLLFVRLVVGYISSELIYKRLKAVTMEGPNDSQM